MQFTSVPCFSVVIKRLRHWLPSNKHTNLAIISGIQGHIYLPKMFPSGFSGDQQWFQCFCCYILLCLLQNLAILWLFIRYILLPSLPGSEDLYRICINFSHNSPQTYCLFGWLCKWASLFTCFCSQAQLTRPFHDPAKRWQLHPVPTEQRFLQGWVPQDKQPVRPGLDSEPAIRVHPADPAQLLFYLSPVYLTSPISLAYL